MQSDQSIFKVIRKKMLAYYYYYNMAPTRCVAVNTSLLNVNSTKYVDKVPKNYNVYMMIRFQIVLITVLK